MAERLSYRDAGVNLDVAEAYTADIAGVIAGAQTGFAAVHPLPVGMREPLLVSCTDGVGTKVLLAKQLERTAGLGQDLVAMCVNDLVCTGARPLVFLDYLAVGVLEPALAAGLVRSIAAACETVGCALAGGETAEMPGLYAPGHFDLAGFACGVVERSRLLGPQRVAAGDVIVGVPSSGVHSNGFSLVRALVERGVLPPDPDLLLTPTRLYVNDLHGALDAGVPVNAAAHITGGGLPENLPRALPAGCGALIDPERWERPEVLERILASGQVEPDDAWRTFNMGIGFCLVVPPSAVDAACAAVGDARPIGRVVADATGVRFGEF